MFDRLNTFFAAMTARLYAPEEGQAMAEYALVLALVAVAVAAFLTPLGSAIGNKIGSVTSTLGG